VSASSHAHGNACGCQDDLISIAQFDLDQQQSISSPQAECNPLLSLCPCIKQRTRRRESCEVRSTNRKIQDEVERLVEWSHWLWDALLATASGHVGPPLLASQPVYLNTVYRPDQCGHRLAAFVAHAPVQGPRVEASAAGAESVKAPGGARSRTVAACGKVGPMLPRSSEVNAANKLLLVASAFQNVNLSTERPLPVRLHVRLNGVMMLEW
jgi:hypothetical protein